METLLIVLAAILLIAAIVVLVKALQRPKKPKTPTTREDPLKFAATMPQFGPRQLGPGAIVSHGGIDYVVRGSVTLRQGPFVWWEHLLEGDSDSDPLWFSVEEDEGRLELVMWTRRKDAALQPGGELAVDGIAYRETERGSASFTTEGTTGLPAGGEMEFVDYANADETSLLGFERWAPDMPWEVSTGRPVRAGELTVYPAPPPSD
ncbi:hypothetical protein AU190_12045 [Mycolicibacterium acapulense]|uniref:DUF4178 domain-containing protein n=1 Tax=Mycobacterium lehmannii TaxID=2048550 RepID=UPI0007493098|nr:DUF4178 domain-containing protein [Mycobacterium lehmannii]KUH98376.1 hypothetical protein AU190_12045 [Mycolicibacterium acapulense]KUH98882.1 hypothetical protein AU189_07490 [Mycolicibacterium acapulense]KUI18087.1 hypothetical protein AU191_02130 [Mycolicibacterium acapulense]